MSELDKLRNNLFNNLQYIEKLENENKQLKEDIKTFKFTIKTQQQMIDELIEKINKAIEYIKEKQKLNNMFGTITLSKDSQNELLIILGDKE